VAEGVESACVSRDLIFDSSGCVVRDISLPPILYPSARRQPDPPASMFETYCELKLQMPGIHVQAAPRSGGSKSKNDDVEDDEMSKASKT